MTCLCLKKILFQEDSKIYSVKSYIESEKDICNNLLWEINQHHIVSSTINLNNNSYLSTEIHFKHENCYSKSFNLACLYKILQRHYKTLSILEDGMNKTKQQSLKIEISGIEKYLSTVNTLKNYIDCLREYIVTKARPIRLYSDNVDSYSILELQLEVEKHMQSLNLLQFFSSLKNFYKPDFETSC